MTLTMNNIGTMHVGNSEQYLIHEILGMSFCEMMSSVAKHIIKAALHEIRHHIHANHALKIKYCQ
jgi:hypothetical protein